MRKYLNILAALVLIFVLWHFASALTARAFFPGPIKTFEAILLLNTKGVLFPHLTASIYRIVIAVFLSTIFAAILGLAAGRVKRVDDFLSPIIYLLHPLPKTAMLPVIMLFMGFGEASRIFLVGFIVFSQMLLNIRDAAKQTPAELLDSVRSMGAGRAGMFAHVIVPSVLPGFFTGLRVSLGTAVAVLFLAETFASQSGLGFLIMDAWTRLAYAEMYAAILVLGFAGLALFVVTDLAEALLCPWNAE